MSFPCKFCEREFTTKQGLSSHYKVHKDLPLKTWVEQGPARSKIKTAFLRARREALPPPARKSRKRALSPVPLRAVKKVGPHFYELPWLTQAQTPLAGGPTGAEGSEETGSDFDAMEEEVGSSFE